MKQTKLLIVVTGLCISGFCSQAQGYDFQYSFLDVYSPNALDYVVGQVKMQRTFAGGVSFWSPISIGQEATLTMEFQVSTSYNQLLFECLVNELGFRQ